MLCFLSILLYSLHFEKLGVYIGILGFNCILLVYTENYAFCLTKSRLRPNLVICSPLYFCLSLSFLGFKDSSALFALLLMAVFSVHYQCLVLWGFLFIFYISKTVCTGTFSHNCQRFSLICVLLYNVTYGYL